MYEHCVIEYEMDNGALAIKDIRDYKSHGYRASDINRMKKIPGTIYATMHKGKRSAIRMVTVGGYQLVRL